MPRPGQVVPRAPADSEHGATAQLQRVAAAVPSGGSPPGGGTEVRPSAPPSTAGLSVAEDTDEELNDGFDEVLFASSDRPEEPLTEGSPFGAGSNWRPRPFEDNRAFMLRVADEIERSPAGQSLAAFIEDIRNGR